MPDEMQLPDNTPQSIAPGLDAELDAALNKSFAGKLAPEVKKEAPPKKSEPAPIENNDAPASEVVEPVESEVKKEAPKKLEKPSANDKPIITPEEAEKLDPKSQAGWNAIKNSNKKSHHMLQERDAEIAKLKATLAEKGTTTQKELDTLKAEKAELEKYRAMVDIQADPEFISKYDEPINKAKNDIKESIKKLGVSQETVDSIDFNDPVRMENIIDLIAQNKDRFTASKMERKVREYLDLNDKRLETMEQHKNNYKETLEQKKKESFAKSAEGEGRMIKFVENFINKRDEQGKPVVEFLNKIEPKEGATQGELDQVNRHNELADKIKEKVYVMLKAKEPEDIADLALTAGTSIYLSNENQVLKRQLEKMTQERNKIAAVNNETPYRKPNNPTGRNGNSEPMDTDTALATHFGRR